MFCPRDVKVFRFCSTAATKSLLVWIIFFAMETRKVNKFGRSYRPGVALDQDFKCSIIDRIISYGGDRITGYITRSFTQLADELRVSVNTVKSVWYRYCEEMQTLAKPKGGSTSAKLQEEDLELIEVLKVHSPAMSLSEIIEELEQFGGQQISMSAVSRAIKNRLPSGQQYSRKKLTKVASERFTADNLFYTQLFINYLSSKDPRRLKFFDEAGVKIPDVGTRTYGHSAKGTRCVEVSRKLESPNTTLSMLVSLNGPEYYNVVRGAANTARFLSFFQEAGEAVNIETGRPCLEVGDIVIMDNLSSHH